MSNFTIYKGLFINYVFKVWGKQRKLNELIGNRRRMTVTLVMRTCYSKLCPSISLTWEFIRNAESWAPSWNSPIRTCTLMRAHVIYITHISFRSTDTGEKNKVKTLGQRNRTHTKLNSNQGAGSHTKSEDAKASALRLRGHL